MESSLFSAIMNTPDNRQRAGIAGVGHIGRFHTRHLSKHSDWQCAGIFDPDNVRAQTVAEEFGVPLMNSAEQLIDVIDALFITSPTPFHFSLAHAALTAGKHVFIEKPITSTLDEAQQLLELAKQQGLQIQVGHIERFNPALLALDDMDLAPRFIEAHRLVTFVSRGLANPVVHENMIHDIDIILSLVKSPVKDVQANGVRVVSEHADIANARLSFENGCVANVTASRVSLHPVRKMRIFQPETYITIDFQQGTTEVYSLMDSDSDSKPDQVIPLEGTTRSIGYRNLEFDRQDAMYAEQASFARSIQAGTTPVVSGLDGYEALRIADIINEQLLQQT